MQIVSILGSGLMGSSLGLALKKRGVPVRVHLYARREETRVAAIHLGVTDAVFADPSEAVKDADLVVLCVPVLTIPPLAKACLPGLKAGAVLTDVGSTKAKLICQMNELLLGTGAVFVGSHPICGAEQQGIEAADSDLYEGAMTVVTPQSGSSAVAVETVSNLWKSAGSRVCCMSAEDHDGALAKTSHLPHVVAAALSLSAGDTGLLCGSGFRDTTRIAEGSPEVWRDIVLTNASALQAALKTFRENLDELAGLIEECDGGKLEAWFTAAQTKRRELLG